MKTADQQHERQLRRTLAEAHAALRLIDRQAVKSITFRQATELRILDLERRLAVLARKRERLTEQQAEPTVQQEAA